MKQFAAINTILESSLTLGTLQRFTLLAICGKQDEVERFLAYHKSKATRIAAYDARAFCKHILRNRLVVYVNGCSLILRKKSTL